MQGITNATSIKTSEGVNLSVLNTVINGSSLIREGNVFSNFSTGNYLTIPLYDRIINNTLNIQSVTSSRVSNLALADSWEIVTKIRVLEDSHGPIWGQRSNNFTTPQLYFENGTTNTYGIDLYLSMDGRTWKYDLANDGHSDFAWELNTDYYVKAIFTGTHYKVDISTDGNSFTTIINIEDSAKVYGSATNSILAFGKDDGGNILKHSQDLSEMYIKMNGQIWWQAVQTSNLKSANIYL